ncbi:MAG: CAP domain-containing protein [Dehalococcoidales bacterium]|nr:CAP domain-containing protein [Dehalococcoidales bacterium]
MLKNSVVLFTFLLGIIISSAACLPVTSASPVATGPIVSDIEQLTQYMLDLINKDRRDNGLSPVTLGSNTAAQEHAENMLANYYISHWDTDGLKPYMRYTLAGGVSIEAENSAYHGWYDIDEDAERYEIIDPEEILKQLQYNMVFDDADSNWGHRDTILDKMSKKVNIGIAYDKHRLALVQQFEGDYITFTQLPAVVNGKLFISGSLNSGKLYSVHVYYDSLPESLNQQQLLDKPKYYDLGEEIGYIIPPKYKMEDIDYVNASKWETEINGSFIIEANINSLFKYPTGVYNICLIAAVNNEMVSISNYSLFIR